MKALTIFECKIGAGAGKVPCVGPADKKPPFDKCGACPCCKISVVSCVQEDE